MCSGPGIRMIGLYCLQLTVRGSFSDIYSKKIADGGGSDLEIEGAVVFLDAEHRHGYTCLVYSSPMLRGSGLLNFTGNLKKRAVLTRRKLRNCYNFAVQYHNIRYLLPPVKHEKFKSLKNCRICSLDSF